MTSLADLTLADLSLADLQRDFVAAVRGEGDATGLLAHIRGDGLDPDARLDIYRNNFRENGRRVLASMYPVIERLVGAAFFDGLAARHLAAHPSHSGDVTFIGRELPLQLDHEFGPQSAYPWFGDVARLEWAIVEVQGAADVPALDLDALATLGRGAAGDEGSIALALHPAVRLVESRWPVLAVWRAHGQTHSQTHDEAHGEAEPDFATIDFSRGERVCIRRTPEGALLEELPPGTFALLVACGQGATLESALAAAAAVDPAFDAAAALLAGVQASLFVRAASS